MLGGQNLKLFLFMKNTCKRRKVNIRIYNIIFQCDDITVKFSLTAVMQSFPWKYQSLHFAVINSSVQVRFHIS